MKYYFTKVSRTKGYTELVGLVPSDEESTERLRKLGDGEVLCCEVVAPRSVPFHRMYFGLCRLIGQNQDPPRDEDSIDHELRVLGGHYDVMYVMSHGERVEVRVPKRIAFHKLTREQWQALWPSLATAIAERFGPEYLEQAGGIAA